MRQNKKQKTKQKKDIQVELIRLFRSNTTSRYFQLLLLGTTTLHPTKPYLVQVQS